jgi:class 3 adenylate cyclase/tetratricopeptide (TPR) repeat protein
MISVSEWLATLDLQQYASIFAENEVDLRTLQVLSDSDLRDLGLPYGPRKRLLNALAELKGRDTSKSETSGKGERRQITVLFCDMVGFTELAHRVDPEVLQGIIHRYEDACAVCITRYDGYVFQRLGDGIVAFFGFPLAHEGEAERAIRAALKIVETMAQLIVPEVGRIEVRIGIATGIVVVESVERGAVGETMNLAARLQNIAAPGNIVVSERVRRLAGGAFDYDDLGELNLKGIARPSRAFRVKGSGAAVSRFDAATSAGVSPLVGREQEIGLLLERWHQARNGAGQVVLVSGEPGIGKSRILSVLRQRAEAQGIRPLRFQCSPFYVNSAFYPIIATFERALAIGRNEPAASSLDKLEALIVGRFGQPLKDVRFIAAMLSVAFEERYGALTMSPQLVKLETNRVLVNVLKAAAGTQTSLMLFEDLHWADPSSLEVLNMLISQLGDVSMLAVLTSRPEFQATWAEHSYVSTLNLARLSVAQSSALIAKLVNGKTLPENLAARIVAKTDGVPLFVEELTKAILESGDLIDEGDRYAYSGSPSSVSIPETLRDSLTARLDRVAAVKQVAQVGAIIGREFSYELLAALELMPDAALARALSRLTESELAFNRGTIPNAFYTFKHALVQDAAYDSLLKTQRQPLHAKIAKALAARWPETADTQPELLAHHFTEAGLAEDAIPLWRRAGELAMQAFALPEAVTHLSKGMSLLETLPATPARDAIELSLRTSLAPAVIAQRGWGHAQVGRTLEPAWRLAESLAHRAGYLPILNALWVHYMCMDRLDISLQWAQKILSTGDAVHDDSLEIVGHRAMSATYYWMGDFISARKHGDIVQSSYDFQRHSHIAQLTNSDPLTGEGIYRTQYLWILGYPDQAVVASDAKDQHARRRNHPFDLAFALTLGAQVFDFRCEPDELLRRTEEGERVGREHGVALMWEVMAEISRSIVWLRSGRIDAGVRRLDKAIERIAATGHRIWIWYLRALEAEGLALTGDFAGARSLIDESVRRIQSGEERAHFAEVLRLKGWILIQQGHTAEAEAVLRAAIDVARTQKAKSWELRSATTLARLLADRGDAGSAQELLAPVYSWFTEGFDTRDLKEAKTLLEAG